MKKFSSILLAIFVGGFSAAMAQSANIPDGVYIKSTDLMNHEVSYSLNPDKKTDKIVLNDFLSGSQIRVTSNGQKKDFNKNELFGYRYHQQDYRFYNNTAYKIVDTTGFYLYSHEQLVPHGKGYTTTNVFYFSMSPNGAMLMLTLNNLDKAYSQNDKFRYALESEFHNDNELTAYDNYIRMYKIKHIFLANASDKRVYSQVK
jgi:hypothetical protein